jgi:hypothetical protein
MFFLLAAMLVASNFEVTDFLMGCESYLRLYVFEFESSRRFQFLFTDFSLVYRTDISKVTAHDRIQHL